MLLKHQTKTKSNNLVALEIVFVEKSSNLIGQENFGTKMQELDFSEACGFHRKQEDH